MVDERIWRMGRRRTASFMEAALAVPAHRRMSNEVTPGWTAHDVVWHVVVLGRSGERCCAPLRTALHWIAQAKAYYDGQNELALPQGRRMSWGALLEHFARST